MRRLSIVPLEKLARLDSALYPGQNGNNAWERGMCKTPRHIIALVVTLFLFLPVAFAGQVKKKTSNSKLSAPARLKAAKAPNKLSLQSLTLVSTSEAARKAAEEASAKAEKTKTRAGTSILRGARPEADGAVIEFHAVDGSFARDSSKGTSQAKSQKKSVLKNIHGSAYGATASAFGRATGEGGAVGASSGNGKFSVYVEGQHTQASTPAPH